jgi:uncharacterized protein YggT (Ycf19 family)
LLFLTDIGPAVSEKIMGVIDFILNVAGVLLWFNWRSLGFDPLAQSKAATLVGTLRRAEARPQRRWPYLLALLALLYFRALLYWEIGPSVAWIPSLKLGAISIPFRSDIFLRACVFSALSFGISLAVSYLWLLLMSLANAREAEPDPVQRLVRMHLGLVDRWPWVVKLLVPVLVTGLFWAGLRPLLAKWGMVPHSVPLTNLLQQAGAVGLSAYLTWKYLLAGVLALYLLSSYVYLGHHALWNFLALTGKNILAPIRFIPLRFGKIDVAPILGVVLVLAGSELAERGLTALYSRVPL